MTRGRTALALPLALAVLWLGAACRLPEALSSQLPAVEGTVDARVGATQPFLAPADGLAQVSVALVPRIGSTGELVPRPTGGAALTVRYDPGSDPRFPDGPFHDWPQTHAWLGELTGDQVIGQSFASRYPNLSGITLRVATYGGDLSPGTGVLRIGREAVVLNLPIDGAAMARLPGGSTVEVTGAAEGWVAVRLADGRTGFIERAAFERLPAPGRHNTEDVHLALYEEGTTEPVRTSTLNAATLHDNSHVTFSFEPLPDSNVRTYRFELSSPRSRPGNAVSFRYAPTTPHPEGHRFENGAAVDGALIFRPVFAEGAALYRAEVDSLSWSSLNSTFIAHFEPIDGTRDRFLALDLTPGESPLTLKWSLSRPAGGAPIKLDGDAARPGGGLVFNATFQRQFPLRQLGSAALDRVSHDARRDPAFFGLYGLAIVGLLAVGGWSSRRSRSRGR